MTFTVPYDRHNVTLDISPEHTLFCSAPFYMCDLNLHPNASEVVSITGDDRFLRNDTLALLCKWNITYSLIYLHYLSLPPFVYLIPVLSPLTPITYNVTHGNNDISIIYQLGWGRRRLKIYGTLYRATSTRI